MPVAVLPDAPGRTLLRGEEAGSGEDHQRGGMPCPCLYRNRLNAMPSKGQHARAGSVLRSAPRNSIHPRVAGRKHATILPWVVQARITSSALSALS